jgi:hypothetical protein
MKWLKNCRYKIMKGKVKDHFSSMCSPCLYICLTHNMKRHKTRGWTMLQCQKFPPSKASNIPSNTWFGEVLLDISVAVAGLSVLQFLHYSEWWKYVTNGSIGLLQELRWGMTRWNMGRCQVLRPSHQSQNLKASGETSLGVAIVFCTFRSLITVKFIAKWTLGEGCRKLARKTRRWVVRWHVVWLGWKWETCLLSARISDCICFMLDICFCSMPIP